MASRLRRYVRGALWHIGYGWGPRIMSELRKRWILLSHPHANIVFEGPVQGDRGTNWQKWCLVSRSWVPYCSTASAVAD